MATKQFSAGETLTAADTNTYLANSGLVYITSGALSGTSKNFEGCFTSTYTNYRIVIDSAGISATGGIYYQFLTNTTPESSSQYFWAMTGLGHTGGSFTTTGAAQAQGFTGIDFDTARTAIAGGSLEVLAPALSSITQSTSTTNSYNVVYYNRTGGSVLNIGAAYNGIRFLTGSAATMTGNVTIYGYRKS